MRRSSTAPPQGSKGPPRVCKFGLSDSTFPIRNRISRPRRGRLRKCLSPRCTRCLRRSRRRHRHGPSGNNCYHPDTIHQHCNIGCRKVASRTRNTSSLLQCSCPMNHSRRFRKHCPDRSKARSRASFDLRRIQREHIPRRVPNRRRRLPAPTQSLPTYADLIYVFS